MSWGGLPEHSGSGAPEAATRAEAAALAEPGRATEHGASLGHRMLSLPPVPAAARLARSWVESVLDRWTPEASGNAALVVCELVTNAVLHARTEIVLECEVDGDRARFDVHDEVRGAPILKPYAADAPTGRGMHLVNNLALEWGVEPGGTGKSVWCVVSARPTGWHGATSSTATSVAAASAESGSSGGGAPSDGDPAAASRDPDQQGAATAPVDGRTTTEEHRPVETVDVKILGLPLDVYYEAEEHNDAVIRELSLIVQSSQAPGGVDVPRRLLALAEEIAAAFSGATTELRDQVERARAAGDESVDLEVRVRFESWDLLTRLATQLDELDRFCEEGAMLTLASSPRLRRFRRWYAEEVRRQAQGLPPGSWPGEEG